MATLSWGKPKIKIGKLPVSGGMSAITEWIDVDTPVEGTTALATSQGATTDALEEGGAIIDRKTAKSTYSLDFTLYEKKGKELPIEDEDGIVTDNYALKLQPEDAECKGIIIPKAFVSVEHTYSVADGSRAVYHFTAVVPDDGGAQLLRQVVTFD